MARETHQACQVATEVMNHQIFKIHNPDDFNRITRGIKVAQCMQSRSSYGKHVSSDFTGPMSLCVNCSFVLSTLSLSLIFRFTDIEQR